MNNHDVVVIQDDNLIYPKNPPFNPCEQYPEYPFIGCDDLSESNYAYPAIRYALYKLGLDKDNFGTKSWNPLGDLIKPDDCVLLKPNLVVDARLLSPEQFSATVTHGSIIRALLDYVIIALKGQGKIIVGDGPIDIASFEDIIRNTGILDTVNYFKNMQDIPIQIIDFRDTYLSNKLLYNIKDVEMGFWRLIHNVNSPGFKEINLNDKSEFESIKNFEGLRSTQLATDNKDPSKKHSIGKHIYGISSVVFDADVIINIPKLKAHKKTGNSLSLKNMVGTTVPRSWMPHYTEKIDEYEKENFLDKILKFVWDIPRVDGYGGFIIRKKFNGYNMAIKGSNHTNHTLNKSIIDVNKIILYADKLGTMKKSRQRNIINFIDGIIGGEKDSPLMPSPRMSNTIIAGLDMVAVDVIATKIMGYDPRKINLLQSAINSKNYPITDIKSFEEINIISDNILKEIYFEPPYNWKNYLAENKKRLVEPL